MIGGEATPSTWNLWSKWPLWSEIANFKNIFSLVAPQPKHLAKNSSTNTNRKFAMSPRWTSYVVPKSPKGWKERKWGRNRDGVHIPTDFWVNLTGVFGRGRSDLRQLCCPRHKLHSQQCTRLTWATYRYEVSVSMPPLSMIYRNALSGYPPPHPKFPYFMEQSTRFCSLSDTSFLVLRKCWPSNDPV